MTQTVTAVYENGVHRPLQPEATPPAEGSVVRLTVAPEAAAPEGSGTRFRTTTGDDSLMVEGPTDLATVREVMARIIALPMEPVVGDPKLTNRDHDKILYGGPEGVR